MFKEYCNIATDVINADIINVDCFFVNFSQ